jgi:methionyl-tRNA formyltransferase
LYITPCAHTTLNGTTVKILKCNVVNEQSTPGKIVKVSKDGILVGTGNGSILITMVQIQGKNAMEVKQLINGKNIFQEGAVFE